MGKEKEEAGGADGILTGVNRKWELLKIWRRNHGRVDRRVSASPGQISSPCKDRRITAGEALHGACQVSQAFPA